MSPQARVSQEDSGLCFGASTSSGWRAFGSGHLRIAAAGSRVLCLAAMDWDTLTVVGLRSREANPEAFAAAQGWLQESKPQDAVRDRLRSGERQRAEALLLAVGHLQARGAVHPLTAVLPEAQFRDRLWRALGSSRSKFVRVCLAAARCGVALDALVGDSTPLAELKRRVWEVCFGESLSHALYLEPVLRQHDVLLVGEVGAGKALVARAIQEATLGNATGSPAPSSAIHVAAVPEAQVEAELFGCAPGALAGEADACVGRLRSTHGGSFFLEEVEALPPTAQAALLRVMETGEVLPLGSDETQRVDIRYVAATAVDLALRVDNGTFRRDLYERLASNEIALPPLRDRVSDIPALGRAFVERWVGVGSKHVDWARLDEWLRTEALAKRVWRGNERELQAHLRDWVLGLKPHRPRCSAEVQATPCDRDLSSRIGQGVATMEEVQRWYFARVLEKSSGSVAMAADRLAVSQSAAEQWLLDGAGLTTAAG